MVWINFGMKIIRYHTLEPGIFIDSFELKDFALLHNDERREYVCVDGVKADGIDPKGIPNVLFNCLNCQLCKK